jgi:hypothetical protein
MHSACAKLLASKCAPLIACACSPVQNVGRRSGNYPHAGCVGYVELDLFGVSPRRHIVYRRTGNYSESVNFRTLFFLWFWGLYPETMCHILGLRYPPKHPIVCIVSGSGVCILLSILAIHMFPTRIHASVHLSPSSHSISMSTIPDSKMQ